MFKIEENEDVKKQIIGMYWRMAGGHETKMAAIRTFWNEMPEKKRVCMVNWLGTNLPDFVEANFCNGNG